MILFLYTLNKIIELQEKLDEKVGILVILFLCTLNKNIELQQRLDDEKVGILW